MTDKDLEPVFGDVPAYGDDKAGRPNPAAREPEATNAARGASSGQPAKPAERRMPRLHSGRRIVPREGVAGQALLTVISIMAFLACLTLGTVFIIRDTASGWQSDIAREITVQIRPFDNVEMDEAVRSASRLLLEYDGIDKVTALNREDTVRLLEPWLGSGLQMDELPIPALLTVTLSGTVRPDFEAIAQRLESEVPGASLDDHRSWAGRLSVMANTTVIAGIVVFVLVMTATVLTVVFATRGAMAGNRDIVDVLHFVGADRVFIAREFEQHFLLLGLKGAAIGGISSLAVFLLLGFLVPAAGQSPQGDQIAALFGSFAIGFQGIVGILVVASSVAVLTGLTSRITVMRQVGILESYGGRQRLS